MGACFSVSVVVSSSDDKNNNYAKVITFKGHLLQYPAAAAAGVLSASVSQVLLDGDENDDTHNSNKMFVCDSDTLYYNPYIPALKSHACLQPNHMYFILPVTLLQTPLSANDMASLAVKAAQALPISTTTTSTTTNKKKKIKKLVQHLKIMSLPTHRISPHDGDGEGEGDNSSSTTTIKTFSPSLISSGNNSSSSSSVKRRLSRYSSSTRAKLSAVRSFRLTLNTIYEGLIL